METLRQRVQKTLESNNQESRACLKILWALHSTREGLPYDRLFEAVTGRPRWRSQEAGRWLRRLVRSLCDQGILKVQRSEGVPSYLLTSQVRNNLASWLETDK